MIQLYDSYKSLVELSSAARTEDCKMSYHKAMMKSRSIEDLICKANWYSAQTVALSAMQSYLMRSMVVVIPGTAPFDWLALMNLLEG